MQTITEHGKALISDDPDEKDDNNHEIEDLEEEFESTPLSEFPAIIFPSQMVYWTDHLAVERLTIQLLLPSGCAPGDIDAVISPGGLEVVVTYKWPEVIMNAMALFEMYSTPTGALKYTETHLKIGAFAANTCELHSEQLSERFCSIQKFPLAFQFQEKFTHAEDHNGKEFLQMLDESTNLLLEMLNPELEALHTSYDHIKPVMPVCVLTSPTQQQQCAAQMANQYFNRFNVNAFQQHKQNQTKIPFFKSPGAAVAVASQYCAGADMSSDVNHNL